MLTAIVSGINCQQLARTCAAICLSIGLCLQLAAPVMGRTRAVVHGYSRASQVQRRGGSAWALGGSATSDTERLAAGQGSRRTVMCERSGNESVAQGFTVCRRTTRRTAHTTYRIRHAASQSPDDPPA